MRRAFEVICICVLALSSCPLVAQARGGHLDMPNYDVGVSWKEPWRLSNSESVPNKYDLIEVQYGNHDIYQMFYGFPWTESSSEDVTHRFVDEFLSDKANYEFVQDWSPGGASGPFPEIISYTEGGKRWEQRVIGYPLGDGQSAYAFVIRIAESPDPIEFREWNRLVTVDFPASFGNGSHSSVSPTPTTVPDTHAAEQLADDLRTTAFTDEELGGYCCLSLEPDSGATEPISVIFDLKGPAHLQSLGYWIFSSSSAAARNYEVTMSMKLKDFPVSPDVSGFMGPNATLLMSTDGYAAGCFVLVDNVVAFGSAIGGSGVFSAGDIACEIAMRAVVHLANVEGK